VKVPGWDSPEAVSAVHAIFSAAGILSLAALVVFEVLHHRTERPGYRIAEIVSLALLVFCDAVAFPFGCRESYLKDQALTRASENAAGAQQYSFMANFDCSGAYTTPSGTERSVLSNWYGRYGRKTKRRGLVVKCRPGAVPTFRRAVSLALFYSCPYLALAACLKQANDPDWKHIAEEGVRHARGTCRIFGHHPDHDRVGYRLRRLLAEPDHS
jgi:hypothetical protein